MPPSDVLARAIATRSPASAAVWYHRSQDEPLDRVEVVSAIPGAVVPQHRRESAPRRLRIAMMSWGTTGDIRPLVCLGEALITRGHQVTLAACSVDEVDYQGACSRIGMRWLPIPRIISLELPELRLRLASRSPKLQLQTLLDVFLPLVPSFTAAATELARDHDLMLGHFLVHPSRVAAQARGIPHLSLCFWPGMIPSRHQAPWQGPGLGAWGNQLCWSVARTLLNHVILPRIAPDWRAAGLETPRDTMRDAWFSPRGNLIACDPLLVGPDPGWGPGHHLCGDLSASASADAVALSEPLEAFLRHGPPPLLMTLGSSQLIDPDHAMQLLIDCARHLGCRAIIPSSTPRYAVDSVHDHVFVCGPTNHRRLMARCVAVVHHGGAGTSHAVARSGVPSLAVAFMDEQLAWGRLLHRHGIAARPLRYHGLTAELLAQRVSLLLADPDLRSRSQEMARRMGAGDGTRTACALVEQTAASARTGAGPASAR